MITINLLPEELRKKESIFANIDLSHITLQKLPLLSIAAAFAGVLVLVQVVVLVMGLFSGAALSALTKRYDELAPKRKEADLLKAQVDTINKKTKAIDELMGKRFSWAGKLNALSDAMTPGIWLNELDYDERHVDKTSDAGAGKGKSAGLPGTLAITGYAAGAGEQGTALVAKFIESLKESEAFYADFSQIKLVSSKSDKASGQEVMNFRISCSFK